MTSTGLGALVTTEVEYVDLGQFGERRLHGRVERRLLRVGGGERFRLALGRARPVAVEVSEPGRDYTVPIEAPEDPTLTLAKRLLLLVVASWAAGRVLARIRHTRR